MLTAKLSSWQAVKLANRVAQAGKIDRKAGKPACIRYWQTGWQADRQKSQRQIERRGDKLSWKCIKQGSLSEGEGSVQHS